MAREDAAGVGFDHQLAEDLGLDHFMNQARQLPRGRRREFTSPYRTPDDLLSCCILAEQGPQAGRQLAVGAHSVDQAAHHGGEVRGEVAAAAASTGAVDGLWSRKCCVAESAQIEDQIED